MAHAMPQTAHQLKIMHALSSMLFLLQWGCVARELVSRFRAGFTPENGVYVQNEVKWLLPNSHARDGACDAPNGSSTQIMHALSTMLFLLQWGCVAHELVSKF